MDSTAAAAAATGPAPSAAAHERVSPRICEVCGAGEVKYCCPRCSKKTCSLACVTAHKEEAQCSGKRDRTAFLGRGQLDERSLLSDYRFLEEVKLAEDVAKRSKPPAPKMELPSYLQSLVYQSRRRGVQLHILAPGMERRRGNTTRYDGRQQLLSWRVEWNFVAAGCRVANGRVSECAPLAEVLEHHLRPPPGRSMKTLELQRYADAGLGRLTVVLRRERTPANASEYYRIDLAQTLRQQLEGKIIVEFPSFLVLLPEEVEGYILVNSGALTGEPRGKEERQQQQQQQQQQAGEPPPTEASRRLGAPAAAAEVAASTLNPP